MKPASRKFPDDQYDRTGYRYFHKPTPGYVFYTDYKDILFPDEDIYEELTLLEYLMLQFGYNDESTWLGEKQIYYYFTANERVYKTEIPIKQVPFEDWAVQQIHLSEYIELSIIFNQNPEDTLL